VNQTLRVSNIRGGSYRRSQEKRSAKAHCSSSAQVRHFDGRTADGN
jgi:hypothetical protein